MDLLEYQAKELFREIGIPVLPSQCIGDPTDIKRLQIRYPVVLKSQVPAGGRGRAGGIRFVENTIDAIAAARAVFNLPILGQYPQVLLAESRYDADQEFYLALLLDYELRHPVLLGSVEGGLNSVLAREQMQKVIIEQEFSPFYARRLAVKMGLQGKLIDSVSDIVQRMYQIFIQKDLDLVEINPLGISPQGEVMALDGKISVNEYALGRHPELIPLALASVNGHREQPMFKSQLSEFNLTDKQGNIAILCNSTCLAAATIDLIYKAKGQLAKCLILEGYASWDSPSLSSPVQQLQAALKLLTEAKGIKVVLVNILSNFAASEEVAEVIANYILSLFEQTPVLSATDRGMRPTGTNSRPHRSQAQSSNTQQLQLASNAQLPHFVIRLLGDNLDGVKERLSTMPIHWNHDLERAVEQSVSLAKSA
ncbi:MAG: succinate--CoA ligase subunit beta [Symploca sp. SIO1C4]|uniref:Succinate--CoA ligase subunit beta n=1 Tax=Symploca sp. SIO1C4 TaxID=2607765 RepID=A0A6B3NDJ6_9CYAN|nr:succinate--CoA ligase subunit beta [Symploca sp. SIO1C4]NET04159.1 succinate--CoA ligase subunit beta [Symploca sp. SIO2B6]